MADKIEIVKNKLVMEDMQIGLDSVTQIRGNEEVVCSEINASQLLGVLVVDKISKLEDLNPELLVSKTVVVKENHTIYVWNELENKWEASYLHMYIVNTPQELTSVPEGYLAAFVISNSFIYIKSGGNWNITFNGLYVIDSFVDISSVPSGVNSVIIKTTGALYFRDGLNWAQVEFRNIGDPIRIVSTIEELELIDFNQITVSLVTDILRGGLFIYEPANVGINDGGIIFNGWTRQFSGAQDIYWYGVKGDGVADDTEAIQKFVANNSIINLKEGTYKISKPVTFVKDIQIIGNNSILELSEDAVFNFLGNIEASLNVQGSILPGQSAVTTLNVSNYQPGDLVLIKSVNSHYSSYLPDNKKKYSFFANVSTSVGNEIKLGQGSKSLFSDAIIQRINALQIYMSNLQIKIKGSRVSPSFSFTYCRNSKFDNINVICEADTPIMQLDKCNNMIISNSNINNYGPGSTAIKVIDSDNIIFRANNIYGTSICLDLSNNDAMSNSIGIFESIISSQNIKDNYSIKCSDGLSGLSVLNSQLTGDIALQGGNFIFENCIISLPYRITPNYIQGGIIKFDNCVFYANSKEIVTPLFGNSELLIIKEDLCYVTAPILFYITNNTFVITSQYTRLFELVSVSKGTSITQVEHSVVYKGNKLKGSYGSCIELSLFGPFDKFECDFMDSHKLARLGMGIIIFEIGQKMVSILGRLGLTWRCATFNSFECASVYPANAPTNTNPLTQNPAQQMCFYDIYFQYKLQPVLQTTAVTVQLPVGNVDIITNAGIFYGNAPAAVYYTIQTKKVNTLGYYNYTYGPAMPAKPTQGYQ